jgi:hypothetical protein
VTAIYEVWGFGEPTTHQTHEAALERAKEIAPKLTTKTGVYIAKYGTIIAVVVHDHVNGIRVLRNR